MSHSYDIKTLQNQRRSTLSGLPTEILYLICDNLRPREVHIPQGADMENYVMWVSNDTQSLLHLSNTCRRLRQLLIPRCFEVVYLRNTKESAAAARGVFQRGFSKYVKEVRFFAFSRFYLLNHGKYAYIKATCPNLDPDDKLAHAMEYPNAPESDFPNEVKKVLSNLTQLFPAIETIRVEFAPDELGPCPRYVELSPNRKKLQKELAALAERTRLAISSNAFENPLRSIHVTNRNKYMRRDTEFIFKRIRKLFPNRIAKAESDRLSIPGSEHEPILGIFGLDSDNLAIIEVQYLIPRHNCATVPGTKISRHDYVPVR
ncbi:hypothetical protein FQN55_003038 [Onygenales sp. PD_40]|nr:hypothetical protein FQN55_003038 [Onygenales sp. PD_40]KAK2784702.1 hypothetical protein FQN52_008930 [Onygenales sp. PD_12]KAK2798771.1 hypothetical protein FQN51_007447 [Onygenales sp. PD_10]